MKGYDPAGRMRVARGDLVAGLRALGIGEGRVLQVHTSLSQLGYVEGGAATVVDALLEVVGPQGTVMVPTFNHGAADVYDVRTTPSRNGAVTEALRGRPEARRSVHPTHPYAAIGKHAEALVAGHLEAGTFGRESPLGKLADLDGWILLLGVGMNRNTAAHIGETMARVHCLGFSQHRRRILLDDGRAVRAWSDVWRAGPCLIEWDPLEARLRERGMIRDGRIGEAATQLMKALDVIEVTYEMTFELCPGCPTLPHRISADSE